MVALKALLPEYARNAFDSENRATLNSGASAGCLFGSLPSKVRTAASALDSFRSDRLCLKSAVKKRLVLDKALFYLVATARRSTVTTKAAIEAVEATVESAAVIRRTIVRSSEAATIEAIEATIKAAEATVETTIAAVETTKATAKA